MKRKHLIIGAGSSGCILASKLLDHDDVILVTDGTGDLKPNSYFDREEFKNPMNWAKASYASDKCPIAYVNKSQSRRVIKYAQGIGIGGCSNVNAMLWGWGSELIFDRYWPNNWNAKYMNK